MARDAPARQLSLVVVVGEQRSTASVGTPSGNERCSAARYREGQTSRSSRHSGGNRMFLPERYRTEHVDAPRRNAPAAPAPPALYEPRAHRGGLPWPWPGRTVSRAAASDRGGAIGGRAAMWRRWSLGSAAASSERTGRGDPRMTLGGRARRAAWLRAAIPRRCSAPHRREHAEIDNEPSRRGAARRRAVGGASRFGGACCSSHDARPPLTSARPRSREAAAATAPRRLATGNAIPILVSDQPLQTAWLRGAGREKLCTIDSMVISAPVGSLPSKGRRTLCGKVRSLLIMKILIAVRAVHH